MQRSLEQLREDALAIWQAGVDAVRSDRLVASNVLIEDQELMLGAATASPVAAPLSDIDRLIVIGAGKAGAGMAAGLEQAIGPELAAAKSLQGWVNVPDNCVRPLSRIHLHGARPGGVNEPTAAGVAGAQRILELVEGASPR
ncbi:MAG: DUF4147 domain-containing protein, partial [Planctomycetales bacterium]|nr:DUF4147 domain-containing protein [Planctomycetales bacterium]